MKRRFTDIEKWDKWFRSLSNEYRVLWLYMHDSCDEVGVWQVDFELASFNTKNEYDPEKVKQIFRDRVFIFYKGEKWWLVDYIKLQYKELRLPTEEELEERPQLKHSPAKRYINLFST